jgi:glutathione S-transferase
MALTLFVGNRNVSSWSMRAWLALREKGLSFEERLIDLGNPRRGAELRRLSPAGRVPILVAGALTVFDSLAIMEYVNEAFPGPALLPADPAARGRARSLLAWMHSGMTELRTHVSFEKTFLPEPIVAPPSALAEAETLASAWEAELSRSGGLWLFGALSLADLTFAPVARRLRACRFDLSRWPRARAWLDALWERPSVREWMGDAERLPPFAGYG